MLTMPQSPLDTIQILSPQKQHLNCHMIRYKKIRYKYFRLRNNISIATRYDTNTFASETTSQLPHDTIQILLPQKQHLNCHTIRYKYFRLRNNISIATRYDTNTFASETTSQLPHDMIQILLPQKQHLNCQTI